LTALFVDTLISRFAEYFPAHFVTLTGFERETDATRAPEIQGIVARMSLLM
jgi:hypothetical protein